jgi:hypothetical protein
VICTGWWNLEGYDGPSNTFLIRRYTAHLTVRVTMERSPSWGANSRSVNQEVPCLLWNFKVQYCVHKVTWPYLESQEASTNCTSISLSSILILACYQHLGLSSGLFLLDVCSKTSFSYFSHTSYMAGPSNPPLFNHCNNVWCRVKIMEPSLCNILQVPVTPFF